MQPERILKAIAITYCIYLLIVLAIATLVSIGDLDSFYTVIFILGSLPFVAIIENPIVILFDAAAVFLSYCVVWSVENHRGETRYYPTAFLKKYNNRVSRLLVNKFHINKWPFSAVFSLLTLLILFTSLLLPVAFVLTQYGYESLTSYLSSCSSSSLYLEFRERQDSGENVSNLSNHDWWNKCSKSYREEAYSWIQEDRREEEQRARELIQEERDTRERERSQRDYNVALEKYNDPTNCDRYGYAQYNALSGKCECKGIYVMIDDQCVTAPYCGDSAKYSKLTGECECNTGYKKVGNECQYVSCTANSSYNPKTSKCECFTGYLVRNGQCKSAIELCGISGKYYTATGDCSECGYGEYLKGRDCVREPYCSYGSTFNASTEKCVCNSGYLVKDGKCVSKSAYCDYSERYNSSTGRCDCGVLYVRIGGKCQLDFGL